MAHKRKKAWDLAAERRAAAHADAQARSHAPSARAEPPCSPALPAGAVLYEDAWVIAVNKPAGVIVHGDGAGSPTLTNQLRALLAQQRGPDAPCVRELQALQRLDRETTGIVLFSICRETQPAFDALIARHALVKEYLAVVEGAVPWERRTFDQPIGRDRHDARKMRVSPTGKPAVTHVRVLGTLRPCCQQTRNGQCSHSGRQCTGQRAHGVNLYGDQLSHNVDQCDGSQRIGRQRNNNQAVARTLLAVRIETGRKHQIRVHLSHAGFPLVGDKLYNPAAAQGGAGTRNAEPLMLHARRLAFTHPVTGKPVESVAPAPDWFPAH